MQGMVWRSVLLTFLWLPHVGSDTQKVAPGMNFWMNSAPRRRAPVPDRAWTVMIRFSLIAEESVPRMSSRVTLLYSASPSMGRYSLLYLPRLARSAWERQQGEMFSQGKKAKELVRRRAAWRTSSTALRTRGLPSSVR